MKYFLICIICGFNFCLLSQTIPEARLTNWSNAGVNSMDLEYDIILDFVNEGADPTGVESNDEILNQIKLMYEGQNISLFVPSGSFRFSASVSLPGNFKLSGAGADSTILIFDLNGAGNLINVTGNIGIEDFELSQDAFIGENIISLEQTSAVEVGDWLLITKDDTDLVTSDWATRSVGQIVQVKSIDAEQIHLNEILRTNLNLEDDIQVNKIQMKENVRIENLSILREDESENQTSNIFFNYTSNCKVNCIESRFCNFAHLTISHSSHVEVSGSYFNNAFDFGGGGKAYGVVLQFTTGDCLIDNNIFERLRHSVLLQAAPNGNVISYNYSIDPFWTDTSLPSNSAGDLVLHGNYPFLNLFEGNVCQQIVVDNSHGLNGKRNTFFRNRCELFGIFMNTDPASDGQNYVGNEIPNNGFLLGLYALQGVDHFEHGNNQRGTIIPQGTDALQEASLYLDNAPSFYLDQSHWPPIGPSNPIDQNMNEAQFRYFNNALTACAEIDIPNAASTVLKATLSIYPNPTNAFLNVEKSIQIKQWIIRNMNGQLINKGLVHPIDVTKLGEGHYFLEIKDIGGVNHWSQFVKTQ